jgi:ABC-type amino acid transport substrate-binding protein
VNSLEEFPSDVRVGVQADSVMESFIRKRNKASQNSMQIVTVNSNGVLIEKLKSGEVDVLIVEKPQARHFAREMEELSYFHIEDDEDENKTQEHKIYLRKDSDLIDAVNHELGNLEDTGETQKLIKIWKLQ